MSGHPAGVGAGERVPRSVDDRGPFRLAIRVRALVAWVLVLWVVGLPPIVAANERPNVLLICVDDLRPELACFGASYIRSPNIDRLAAKGRVFLRHYVQAPTCGASRCALLTGRYGGEDNDALFRRKAAIETDAAAVPPSLPEWFRLHGYTTIAVGKVSHHPGGRGGPDWDDDARLEMPRSWNRSLLPAGAWQHPRGWMHGLANGEIRVDVGKMSVFQSVDGPDSIYPDGPSVDEAVRQIEQLTVEVDAPFFLAVGILRPHLPFGAPAKYLAPYADVELPPTPHPDRPAGRTTWHASGEFMKYDRSGRDPNSDADFALEVRRHYAACVSYADAQVGRLLDALEASGAANRTIVVLWGDHGWHLGEHAVWGKHTLFEESLRSPLIVSYAGIANPGVASEALVESIDIFPTLAELARLPKPEFVHGRALRPILEEPSSAGHPAFGYWRGAKTIRTERHRLIVHRDGYVELYDHDSVEGEARNRSEAQPDIALELGERLRERFGSMRD